MAGKSNPIKLIVIALASLSLVAGCGATALKPGAARVMVTKSPAPAGCVYVGSVVGEQGGSFSGAYTSNANLAEGAFNDMKNKAHALGANYVVLENTQAGTTISGNKGSVSGAQTDVTHIGNAFTCPNPAASAAAQGATPQAPQTPQGAQVPQGPSAASEVMIVVL